MGKKQYAMKWGVSPEAMEKLVWTYHTKGTNTMRCFDLEGITYIPQDIIVTYARMVLDYRSQKKIPR